MEHPTKFAKRTYKRVCFAQYSLPLPYLLLSRDDFNARIHHADQQHGAPRRQPEREQEQWNKFGELWCGINGVRPRWPDAHHLNGGIIHPRREPLFLPDDPGLVPCAIFAASNKFTQIYIGRCPTPSNTLPDGDVYYAFRNECGPDRHRDRRGPSFKDPNLCYFKNALSAIHAQNTVFFQGTFFPRGGAKILQRHDTRGRLPSASFFSVNK